MPRPVAMLCAGLLFVATGCALKIGNTQVEVTAKIDEQPVEAKLDNVAENIKKELQRRGLQVTVSPQADAIRLVSATKSGDKFTVVLNRVRLPEGKERTQVRVEWDKAPDRELWLGLLASVAVEALQPPR